MAQNNGSTVPKTGTAASDATTPSSSSFGRWVRCNELQTRLRDAREGGGRPVSAAALALVVTLGGSDPVYGFLAVGAGGEVERWNGRGGDFSWPPLVVMI